MRRISWPAAGLLACQEGLCPMQWVSEWVSDRASVYIYIT